MSADNEIAIIEFPNNTFRLVMIQGCPSIDEIEKYMKFYVNFLKPEIYQTDTEAANAAGMWEDELLDEGYPVEYGITAYTMKHNIEHYLSQG